MSKQEELRWHFKAKGELYRLVGSWGLLGILAVGFFVITHAWEKRAKAAMEQWPAEEVTVRSIRFRELDRSTETSFHTVVEMLVEFERMSSEGAGRFRYVGFRNRDPDIDWIDLEDRYAVGRRWMIRLNPDDPGAASLVDDGWRP
ncbi:hypothetical protein HNR46_003421 [Haloferula luteola]|uniref:Uncharacterized protein n=1 Tax=Haloferula luteola TaxID=595692 RepID=A0A840V4F5_9BACT|nr:DUF3592 domain-containing protein [Haloferula luteola]MBB5353167.1 hypothetical protein [Haloferula luteola]